MHKQDQAIIDRLSDTLREMESYIREEYCTDYDDFLENDILKRAVAMCLISADQLIAGFSDDFITEHQRIIFARFTTLRYIAEHRYRSLDFYALWIAAIQELPAFLNELLAASGMEASATRLGQAQPRQPMKEEAYSQPWTQTQEQARPPIREQSWTQAEEYTRSPIQEQDWLQAEVQSPVQTQAHTPQPYQMQEQAPAFETKNQEARQPFVMNELYKRQAYSQMMQKTMSKQEIAVETKKEVNTLLEMLEKEKRSRGL